MHHKKIIIFDFDGTLADTFAIGIEICNSLLQRFGYRATSKEEFREKGLHQLLLDFKIPRWSIPFFLVYVKIKIGRRMRDIEPMENMVSLVHKVYQDGFQLGILTSNSKKNVTAFLKIHNIESLFDFIYSESNIFGKDNAINHLLYQESLERERVVYIGDETRDIEAMQRANIDMIAVSFGFDSKAKLMEYSPICIADTPQELLGLLQSMH